jgi:hypothetical protein
MASPRARGKSEDLLNNFYLMSKIKASGLLYKARSSLPTFWVYFKLKY